MKRPQPLNNREVTGKDLLNMSQHYWSECRRERYIFRWIEDDLDLLKLYARELTKIPFDVIVYVDKEGNNLELRVLMDDKLLYYNGTIQTIENGIKAFYNNWNKILNNIEYFSTQFDRNANNRINEIKNGIKNLNIFFNKTHLELYKSQVSASKYKLSIYYLNNFVADIFIDKYKENVVKDIIDMNMEKLKNGIEKAILFCYLYNDTLLISEDNNNYLISRIESKADIKKIEQLINCSKVPYDIKNELLDWENEHPLLMEEYLKENANKEGNIYSLHGTNFKL